MVPMFRMCRHRTNPVARTQKMPVVTVKLTSITRLILPLEVDTVFTGTNMLEVKVGRNRVTILMTLMLVVGHMITWKQVQAKMVGQPSTK